MRGGDNRTILRPKTGTTKGRGWHVAPGARSGDRIRTGSFGSAIEVLVKDILTQLPDIPVDVV